jgi:hypothetical protein
MTGIGGQYHRNIHLRVLCGLCVHIYISRKSLVVSLKKTANTGTQSAQGRRGGRRGMKMPVTQRTTEESQRTTENTE